LIKVLAAAVVLAMSTGAALAVMGKTTTDVALRTAPAAQAKLILNLPEGTLVNVGRCSHGWCGVTWNKYGGYVRESALQFQSTPAGGPPAIPVFPPYPYKAGHYPTADAYYELPPYAAVDPSFYRWRFFMMAQERTRYRYMPHIFRGYRDDSDSSYVVPPEPASEPIPAKSPPKAEPTDLDSAASELGARLAGLSQEDRGLALLQFNIENQLMAEAAEKQNLAAGRSFEGWPTYQRRRALRDMYFDKNIRGSVSDQAIKKLYNEKIAEIERESEVSVHDIVVSTEAAAEKVAERLKNGEDFVALANGI
jgi:hypothetical protein